MKKSFFIFKMRNLILLSGFIIMIFIEVIYFFYLSHSKELIEI